MFFPQQKSNPKREKKTSKEPPLSLDFDFFYSTAPTPASAARPPRAKNLLRLIRSQLLPAVVMTRHPSPGTSFSSAASCSPRNPFAARDSPPCSRRPEPRASLDGWGGRTQNKGGLGGVPRDERKRKTKTSRTHSARLLFRYAGFAILCCCCCCCRF